MICDSSLTGLWAVIDLIVLDQLRRILRAEGKSLRRVSYGGMVSHVAARQSRAVQATPNYAEKEIQSLAEDDAGGEVAGEAEGSMMLDGEKSELAGPDGGSPVLEEMQDGPIYFSRAIDRLSRLCNFLTLPGPDLVASPLRRGVLHALLSAASLSYYFLEITAKCSVSVGMRRLRIDQLVTFAVRCASSPDDVDVVRNAVALTVRLYEFASFRAVWANIAVESLFACPKLMSVPALRDEGLGLMYQIAACCPEFVRRRAALVSEVLLFVEPGVPCARIAVATIDAIIAAGGVGLVGAAQVAVAVGQAALADATLCPLFCLLVRRLVAMRQDLGHQVGKLLIDCALSCNDLPVAAATCVVEAFLDAVKAGSIMATALVDGRRVFRQFSPPPEMRRAWGALREWTKRALDCLAQAGDMDATGLVERVGAVRLENSFSQIPPHSWELVREFYLEWAHHIFYRAFHAEIDSLVGLYH